MATMLGIKVKKRNSLTMKFFCFLHNEMNHKHCYYHYTKLLLVFFGILKVPILNSLLAASKYWFAHAKA